jgi:tripeptide aminopeptidase
MDTLLDRFLRYARIDTQAVEGASGYPSSAKQLELSKLLARECREIGLADVTLTEFGIVTGTVPASPGCQVPGIAWFAHVDTSPEFTAENVRPVVHANYDGRDLVLPGDTRRVLRTSENPALTKLVGRTIITTDGTTLLGADDKSGIAVIMTAAVHLLNHPEIVHGPIRVCFTCDEEVGHGVDHVDLENLGVVCGYTLDSEGSGRIDSETFSADLAVVKVTGINTHPSVGKGAMVNAVRILSEFISRESASARIILRDFETPTLAEHAKLLERIAVELRQKHPRARIEIEIHKQYRNMREGLDKEPRALAKAIEAVRAAGLDPHLSQIRGGTDGSVLTERGLPTPNLSSGQHNPHCPLEWTCLEEMQQAVDILIELAKAWGREKG